ncbi:MAG: hypothetical protein HOW97_28570 [Catenulispora sp.]|nr:hypothetical protein [Catenulispora sp.]
MTVTTVRVTELGVPAVPLFAESVIADGTAAVEPTDATATSKTAADTPARPETADRAASTIRTPDKTAAPTPAAQVREARFGTLPAHVPFSDLIAEQPSEPVNPTGEEYYAERNWRHGACAALDPWI